MRFYIFSWILRFPYFSRFSTLKGIFYFFHAILHQLLVILQANENYKYKHTFCTKTILDNLILKYNDSQGYHKWFYNNSDIL